MDIPEGGAEDMIHTNGLRFAGYVIYQLKGRPVFTWNLKRVKWQADTPLSPAKHTIEFDFQYDGLGFDWLLTTSVAWTAVPKP